MYSYHKLPSGLRVIHKQTQSTVAHCGIMIDIGSRDEKEQEHGMAHFIEHVIFKGTTKRKSFHILSRLDNVGGDLNAYTTKEETCIYASFLPAYYDRSLELFSDLLFNSVFPAKEIEKEKDVVYDEITSYLDSPWEQIADDFENMLFKGHPLGRSILGTKEQLTSFSREDIFAFINRNYHLSDMILCSVGNIPIKKLLRYADKYFSNDVHNKPILPRIPINGYAANSMLLEKNTFQTHVIMGNRAFSWNDKKRAALTLLSNYLGGPGMNTRLNMAIREKHGITYNIEAQYAPYSDTGVFFVYMGMDPANADKAIRLLNREFNLIRKTKPGTGQLHLAKKQFKGQIAISQESGLSEMFSMGKSIMVKDKVDCIEEVYATIDAITAEDIWDVANIVLDPQQLSSLIFQGTESE